MLIATLFALLALFVLGYYAAFEYSRYKTAGILSKACGGRVVFKLGGSYMRRHRQGAEERAWVVPDDGMAWGSLLTLAVPASAQLVMQRFSSPGFAFAVELKTGVLFRSLAAGRLKTAAFEVPRLDATLNLRTDDTAKAGRHFADAARQEALLQLFQAGFRQVRGNGTDITAVLPGGSAREPDRLDPERHFAQLHLLA